MYCMFKTSTITWFGGSMLVNKGFILVFEFDKFILPKFQKFIGMDYLTNDIFKINVMVVHIVTKNVVKENASIFS